MLFGGALALAWCTQQARGTIDLDVNVFVGRLWWGTTPVDLVLNTSDFHEEVATRVRWEPFGGIDLPFLACEDLAVFKAFFSRTKDWADLEAMRDAGTLDVAVIAGVLVTHLGGDDERVARLLSLR